MSRTMITVLSMLAACSTTKTVTTADAGHADAADTLGMLHDAGAEAGADPGKGHCPDDTTVSLIELIGARERFDGCRVFVEGFVSDDYEGTAVYVHREDYEWMLTTNGLRLELPDAGAGSGKVHTYFWVEGDFRAKDPTGLYSGVIKVRGVRKRLTPQQLRQ